MIPGFEKGNFKVWVFILKLLVNGFKAWNHIVPGRPGKEYLTGNFFQVGYYNPVVGEFEVFQEIKVVFHNALPVFAMHGFKFHPVQNSLASLFCFFYNEIEIAIGDLPARETVCNYFIDQFWGLGRHIEGNGCPGADPNDTNLFSFFFLQQIKKNICTCLVIGFGEFLKPFR